MARQVIRNPVLRGFEPDPSILRVGDDHYIATSTFEWYPGVRIHHSRDLVHWRSLGGVLDDRRLVDLAGVPDSGGIWAPDLSYADGRFHLVFTLVDGYAGGWRDLTNLVTTAPSIEGPWSDPVPLHGRGFDPSLFHDDDGRSWLLSMVLDWRPERPGFAGIELQEYDRASQRLLGEPRRIFTGTEAGVTEGPHLYRRDGWYYLLVAEGGTGYDHQATVARARSITGPYEADPEGPMLTARHDPGLELQKVGHGCLVETGSGEWYVAHICARPYTPRGRCVLGRETALQRVVWTPDGWPRVPGGLAAVEVPAPDLPLAPDPSCTPGLSHIPDPSCRPDLAPVPFTADRAEPSGSRLGPEWSTLRRPASPDWLRVDGHMRIHGGQSPTGRRAPSLVARRVTATRCGFAADVRFTPCTPDRLAGVTAYYNTRNWHYLAVTAADDGGTVLQVLSSASGELTVHPQRVPVPPGAAVRLHAELDGPVLRFGHDLGAGPQWLPLELDATVLSDEHADEFEDGRVRVLGFTGAMLGLWVLDLDGGGCHADFTNVTYRTGPRPDAPVNGRTTGR
ncbi:glycoside hydrolase family 43 protein [Actinoallomurus vinaceus]|uniref:Glycoside hydrolase family 43 protein n=1 Tax=Actinoallomurus vinaceus TaxID=1080074 RepID=A0ABP8UGU9_9ACTN